MKLEAFETAKKGLWDANMELQKEFLKEMWSFPVDPEESRP